MWPRLVLSTAALVLIVMLLAAAEARGGTYVVRECHHSAPQNHFHEAIADVFPSPGPYAVASGPGVCSGAANGYAIRIGPQTPSLHGQYGLVRFVAPDGTKLIGVELDARLRGEAGHRARLSMANAAGLDRVRVAAGDSGPAGFAPYEWTEPNPASGGHSQFTAGLICDNPGFDCPMTGDGDKSKVSIRNIRLTVQDNVAPTVEMSKDLVEQPWLRGPSELGASASDIGSGLRALPVFVGGALISGAAPMPCATVMGTTHAARLHPCLAAHSKTVEVNTAVPPFEDGPNQIVACAWDFGEAGNATCESKTVFVDNTPPTVTFQHPQLASDPELIRVKALDATSGPNPDGASIEYRAEGTPDWLESPTSVNGGELRTSVNSEAVPQGPYEFRVTVEDVAGNAAVSTTRSDGEPMVLDFPLKEAATLEAELGNGAPDQVVGFRRKGEVKGRLLDDQGAPIAGASVEVAETFKPGSLIERRVREVSTDSAGRYRSALPGGPSRDIEVFYGGSKRYRSDAAHGLDFGVRGAATLSTSRRRVRAGRAVIFRGRVRRYFARIPAGGKLVEVQVKTPTGWTTLQEARGTDPKGRVKLRHRFRGFYTRPVTFIFRLKATREDGWPYRGAAKSRKRRVTVVPKQ